ncbi:MAG: beta-propeller domain-containing protein, partial [Syntrophomonadaceae bacterium]|nr:beta-propeller domain-containing protein [Syntrophomonadaceae bacterium]
MGFMSNKRGRAIVLAAILSLALLWSGGAGYGMAAETGPDATASWWSQLWQSIIDSLRWTQEADEAEDSVAVYTGDPLPTLADAAHLRLLLEENGYTADAGYGLRYPELSKSTVDMIVTESVADAAPAAMDNAGSAGGEQSSRNAANAEYSELNTQVAGVDEADIVRTDGAYIYRVRASQNKIDIIKALPADDMQYMAGIDFSNRDFSPQELYVDGDRLVVIGTTWRQHQVKPAPLQPEAKMISYHYPVSSATCRVITYDLSALPAVTEVRTVEIEGDYLSSRKVEANIYVLTNKHLDYFHVMNDDAYNPNPS